MSYPQPPETLTPQELALARHIQMSPKRRTWITLLIFAIAAAVIGIIAIFTSPAARTYHPVPFNCSQVAYGGGNIAPLCGQSYYSPTLPPNNGDD